jgi:hypothetical protein
MPIKQTIKYNTDSEYFIGFLQRIADDSNIDAQIYKDDKFITILIDDSDSQALVRFSQNTQKFLPSSIFMGEIDTKNTQERVQKSSFVSKNYNIALCPKCLENLNDSTVCEHYSNKDNLISEDTNTYSDNYITGDTVLVVDSSKLQKLFILTQDEIKTLLSIEKPTIKVTIKDEQLKEITGKNYIYIKSPSTLKANIQASQAKASGVEYLFFKDQERLKVTILQGEVLIIEDNLYLSNSLKNLNEDKILNRFLNIVHEAGLSRAIGVNLSEKNGISFLVTDAKNTKYALKFAEFNLADVFELMIVDDKKKKMIVSFEDKYPEILQELQINPEYNIFETLSCIFKLDRRDFESVSDKSLEFRGNGGLKIDTFLKEDGFDYVSFLGSIMSFKLAGTDDHYLAYSTYEALAEMVISILTQLKEKYKINNFIMMGNMFENSVLHSHIVSKFSLSNPYFSKGFALDD